MSLRLSLSSAKLVAFRRLCNNSSAQNQAHEPVLPRRLTENAIVPRAGRLCELGSNFKWRFVANYDAPRGPQQAPNRPKEVRHEQ